MRDQGFWTRDQGSRMSEQGFTVVGSDSETFTRFVGAELPRWSVLIRDIGIKPE